MTNNISRLPSTFKNIQDALAQPRLYREPPEAHTESSQETDEDYAESPQEGEEDGAESSQETYIIAERRDIRNIENARVYETQFNRVFELAATEPPTVTSNREFAAFHNILRCFDEDVDLIADKETSSSLKASNFTVHFIQPPFFSEIRDDSRGFKYNQ